MRDVGNVNIAGTQPNRLSEAQAAQLRYVPEMHGKTRRRLTGIAHSTQFQDHRNAAKQDSEAQAAQKTDGQSTYRNKHRRLSGIAQCTHPQ